MFTLRTIVLFCQKIYFYQRQTTACHITSMTFMAPEIKVLVRSCRAFCQLVDGYCYFALALTKTQDVGEFLYVVCSCMRSKRSQNGDTTQQRLCRSGVGGNYSEEEDSRVGHKLRVSVAGSRVTEKVYPDDPFFSVFE